MGDLTGYEPVELEVDDVQAQVVKIQKLMQSIMKKGQHYGVIPGTNGKNVLFKAGAEKLGFTFRLVASFKVNRNDLPNGHREYEVTCTLIHQVTGEFVGEGVGNCSTMEKKYRYRNVWDHGRKVRGENEDLADTYNTVLKMAKKRAHVDAMITACAASDIFTQDVEDFDEPPSDVPPVEATDIPPEEEEKAKKKTLSETETAVLKGMGTVLEGALFTDADRELFHNKVKAVMGADDREDQFKAFRKEVDELYLKRKSEESEQTELEVY